METIQPPISLSKIGRKSVYRKYSESASRLDREGESRKCSFNPRFEGLP
ncbi:hypothetical protein GCM10008985_34760 [Halococcus dombrowskii]|uniref:Uncharacterized protein n=1 Tax=Halococcus dombrowskii TaxID=179637 RepID=A0AAV3SK80_HALDO